MKIFITIIISLFSVSNSQDLNMNLENINPNSSSYSEWIGPSDFGNIINIYYFGHQN